MSSAPANSGPTQAAPSDSWSGVVISLAFWLTLFIAAAIFAAVSLAPKLAAYLALQEKHLSQQLELVALEQQQTELERVIAALKDDPQFAAELARLEFDAIRPGEEILSVESSLALDPNSRLATVITPSAQQSTLKPWVAVLAEQGSLRSGLLVGAGLLVLLAFGWFHESSAGQVHSGVHGVQRQLGAVWRRYVPPASRL